MIFYGMDGFLDFCRQCLAKSYARLYGEEINWESIFVIASWKTFHNYKALLLTPHMEGMYVEYTYNDDKRELYEDFYTKKRNGTYAVSSEVVE